MKRYSSSHESDNIQKRKRRCDIYFRSKLNIKRAILSYNINKIHEICDRYNYHYSKKITELNNCLKFMPNELVNIIRDYDGTLLSKGLNQSFQHKLYCNVDSNVKQDYESNDTIIPYMPLVCALVAHYHEYNIFIQSPKIVIEILDIIKKYGCNFNKLDVYGRNALFYVFFTYKDETNIGRGVILRYLLLNGVNAKLSDIYGKTAFDYFLEMSNHKNQIDNISYILFCHLSNRNIEFTYNQTLPTNPYWYDVKKIMDVLKNDNKNY